MDSSMRLNAAANRDYWDAHPLGTQFVTDDSITRGTPEFYEHVKPWMTPYRFPAIMARIDRFAPALRGKHLLEIGCGLGFESAEYMKRGVRVTATDLTPTAVALARRHFELLGLDPVDVRTANALDLPLPDQSFDAVSSTGCLHTTGDTARALREVRRVLKPGGIAIISHFYRKPSWMLLVSRLGRENIEFKDLDPPVNTFHTEREIFSFFDGFTILEAEHEHYRAEPIARRGWKAVLYRHGFAPMYNLLPVSIAKRFAYKISVTARKE